MRLTVSLVEGIAYTAEASSLPLLYRIVFEKETRISGSIRATACILENQGNREVSAGWARSIFTLSGVESLLKAGTEVVLDVDALEHEDGPSGLIPGEYEVSAKVAVQVFQPDGSIQHEELRATRQLVLL